MWLIFVLSSMGIAVAVLVIIWIANKVCNQIIRENRKLNKEEREDMKNEN